MDGLRPCPGMVAGDDGSTKWRGGRIRVVDYGFEQEKESVMTRTNRGGILRDGIVVLVALLVGCVIPLDMALADETCNSPYVTKLIKGQEDYVYVWALGV